MKKITFLLLITISLFVFNSCEDDNEGTTSLNYVSFESATYTFGVDLNGSNTRDVTIYTTQVTNTDRTFNVSVVSTSTADPASYTVPTSVVVPANTNVGKLSIKISDINIGEAGKKLILKFDAQEGLMTGTNITLNIKQVCPLNEVILDIKFDGYPDETKWELLNSTGTVISSSNGFYPTSVKNTTIQKAFCLANGTYTFKMYDDWGDGINAPGFYRLSYNGAVLEFVTGAEFSLKTTTFTVNK